MTSRPDAAGNRVPLAPEYTVRGGLNWAIPVADGLKVFGRTAFAVTGPTAFHAIQCQSRPTSFGVLGNYCGSLRKSFITADARAGVRSDRWSIAAYVKNIANDRHVGEAIIIPEFGQSLLRPGDLRRIGADLSLRF